MSPPLTVRWAFDSLDVMRTMTTGQGAARPGGPSRGGSGLTRKQRQVLTLIQKFSTVHGYMPSVRELGRELGGLAPATVQHHLVTLREKGFLEHDGTAHGLKLARPGAAAGAAQPLPSRVQDEVQLAGGGGGGSRSDDDGPQWGLELPGMQVVVPLLGVIAAGLPLEAVEDSQEFVPIPASLARGSTYALRVRGNSMVEEAILDGDLVIVQACDRVDSGTLAVALLPDGGATLKRIHFEKSRTDGKDVIRLQPANSSMQPILVDSVQVRGRVVGLIRRYD